MTSVSVQNGPFRDVRWCPDCGTPHGPESECPGALLATGPERHGWRVTVDTPRGMESFGVLVAPAGNRWRARILTFPNALWTIPGGGGALKFLGATPQEAEAKAIEFIERFCAWRGYPRHSAMPPVESGEVDPERAGPRSLEKDPQPPPRKLRSIPIRFGHSLPSKEAVTLNLSERGLFVSTPAPMDAGAPIRLHLNAEAFSVPLRGVVVWNRPKLESGRPAGMGVRLVLPPALYTNFVRHLP
jgi:Tfp pilus assembly protein PilZ